MRLAVVGDALLDRDLLGRTSRLCPDAPVPVVDAHTEVARPGGAGLAALLAARDGHDVALVTALADDADGAALRELLAAELAVYAGRQQGPTPVKTRVRAAGRSLLRVDRGGTSTEVTGLPDAAVEAVVGADAVLVADYGRGVARCPTLRAALARGAGRAPLVWDPHPRGAEPVPGAHLVTPNSDEAAAVLGERTDRPDLADLGPLADRLVRRWRAGAVALTLGERGAVLSYGGGAPLVVPAPRTAGSDTCGAGDRFAATAAALLGEGRLLSEAVAGAVHAAAMFVASGGAGAVHPPPTGPVPAGGPDLAAHVRARGGTVVATGGCFDLLHAGHVSLLRAARALGDCLVVCVNSDESVRRLKGPDRPVVALPDRIRVLEELSCVDVAVAFDEDVPLAVLDRIRPAVWVKGGDYAGMPLPEADLLRRWGGKTVLLPYLDGRSTSHLIDRCRTTGTPTGTRRERST